MIAGSQRACAVLGALAVAAAMASAHCLRPEEIVGGLAHDQQLRASVGVVGVRNDPKLPRLLIVSVRRDVWDAAPAAERIKLAEEWLDTWRHSVPEGIVAVLDATTEKSVVNFDAVGHAHLKPARVANPAQ